MAVNYRMNMEEAELSKRQPKPSREDQHYADLIKRNDEKENVYEDLQILNQPRSSLPRTAADGHKCLWTITALSMVTSILAVVGVIIIAGVHNSANTVILTRRIEELENQLNYTQDDQKISALRISYPTILDKLYSLQSAVDALNTTTATQLDSLQTDVNTLNTNRVTTTAQLVSLQTEVDTLNTDRVTATAQLDSLQMVVNGLNSVQHATTSQLTNLQTSIDTLTTRVNSPVNLYQNCIQETKKCINSESSPSYFKHCSTAPLLTNVTGYYTLDIKCGYDRQSDHLDTAVLVPGGANSVRCLCHTSRISHLNGSQLLERFSTFTCTLVVTRCPLSQTVH